jgi:hypothetical protein
MVTLTPRPDKLMHLGVTLALGVTLFLTGPAGAQLNALEVLSARVAALEETVVTLQDQVDALEETVVTLQDQVDALQNVQALDEFVSVDPNPRLGVAGPHIIISGANLHLVSGSGATNDGDEPLGLGNLIIGYNEDPAEAGSPLNPGQRGGSHNVVIGTHHKFTEAAWWQGQETPSATRPPASAAAPTTRPAASKPASAAASATRPAASKPASAVAPSTRHLGMLG